MVYSETAKQLNSMLFPVTNQPKQSTPKWILDRLKKAELETGEAKIVI
jgi:hypothetical protein